MGFALSMIRLRTKHSHLVLEKLQNVGVIEKIVALRIITIIPKVCRAV